MKKLFLILGLMMLLSNPGYCVEASGAIFQNTVQPLLGASATPGSKVGKANCFCILGLVSFGDSSIKKASKNGNIRSVGYADQSVISVLGFTRIQTRVYGR